MEKKRVPRPGQIYRHFKNNLYQIIVVAVHSETGEKMVVYQALYGDFKSYVRPLSMFLDEVDYHKYPNAAQKYRFELVSTEDEDETSNLLKSTNSEEEVKDSVINNKSETEKEEYSHYVDNSSQNVPVMQPVIEKEEGVINPVLLEFLDAETYEEKLAILLSKRKYITDKMLNDMAVSIDCTVDEGDIEERISEFAFCLQTHARFENNRFR